MSTPVNIFWFRRDLRIEDNIGFHKALQGRYPVLSIFIFDSEILNELVEDDARVTFIFETLQELRKKLSDSGSGIALFHGNVKTIFQEITQTYNVQNVITNRDYEPYAVQRDKEVEVLLSKNNIGFFTFKDQVIFEKSEVVKADGDPYSVYTPYKNKWLETFGENKPKGVSNSEELFANLYQNLRLPNLTLSDLGFKKSPIQIPRYNIEETILRDYEKLRNFPAEDATSHLGPHLRFGTISIRKVVEIARKEKNQTFLEELIWREFFMQLLFHFPATVDSAFKKKYDNIQWRNNEEEFIKWKQGKTGFPFVDAGMRQLNATGYMHNRARMVTASFLCKHLLIDWRWGEAYFAEKLLDYELSSNVGNWQWATGSGADAAPYFRIFNPTAQIEKFDKNRAYIKKWIPELDSSEYAEEIVDHKEARERCLKVYKSAVSD